MEPPASANRVAALSIRNPFARRWKVLVSLAVVAMCIVGWHVRRESATVRWDFQQFYVAGQMIRHGDASKLYDFASQAAYQTRYVDPSRTDPAPDVPFLYPAATALPFVPLAWLPLNVAFAVWTAINLLLLLLAVRLLQRELNLPENDWPLLAALLFAPVLWSLLHGQVSVLLLVLYTAGFVLMRRDREFLAGVVIGLAALKVQLLVGFVAILIARRRWKSVAGAATGAAAVAFVSGWVVGWPQLLAYPAFLRHAAYHPRVGMPMIMVNIRGFLWLLTGREPPLWLFAAIAALILVAAARAWKDGPDRAFSIAVVATVLTAYHAYAQELTLYLVPIAVAARGVHWNRKRALAFLLALPLVTFGLLIAGAQALMGVLSALLLVAALSSRDEATAE